MSSPVTLDMVILDFAKLCLDHEETPAEDATSIVQLRVLKEKGDDLLDLARVTVGPEEVLRRLQQCLREARRKRNWDEAMRYLDEENERIRLEDEIAIQREREAARLLGFDWDEDAGRCVLRQP